MKLREVSRLEFRLIPYPIPLRTSEDLLTELGGALVNIEYIKGFLQFVQVKQGMEFVESLEGGLSILCRGEDFASQPINRGEGYAPQ
jgi:hypothetical protein